MFAGGLSTGNVADGASQCKFSSFRMCLYVTSKQVQKGRGLHWDAHSIICDSSPADAVG